MSSIRRAELLIRRFKMSAEKVLKSNVIYTGRDSRIISGGVAVSGNKITAVCEGSEIDKYIGPDTEVYEFKDKLIMPGIIDNHVHVTMGAMMHDNDLNLEGTKSAEECVEMVRDFLRRNPDTSLLVASGWMISAWDNQELPRKEMLDEISTEIPICLGTADGWLCWVNSKALEMFGYTKESITGDKEIYVKKDEAGELTGMLYHTGSDPVFFMLLNIDKTQAKEMLKYSLGIYSSFGITAAGDVSNELEIEKEPKGFRLYREMENAGDLDVRMYVYPSIGKTGDFTYAKELMDEYSDGYVIMPGLKAYGDGVIDAHTGVLNAPYNDKPEDPDYNAVPIFTQEALSDIITKANAAGYPVRIHCTGDGSTRMALNAFEASIKANGRHGLRNGIEHIELVEDEDYPRFAELDVMANKQPAHYYLCTEKFMLDALGERRWFRSQPLKSLYDNGAKVSFSTDFPIVEINPFHNMYVAVTRLDLDGNEIGADINEKIDIFRALSGYTYMGAYGMGVEDKIGSLEAGKLADIAVINGRVFDEEPEKLLDRKSVLTMMDGRIVYKDEQ